MGFSYRKSVSAGPFRFNLSKSGVGISAGARGFRVGAGPRGNYVRMSMGGITYQQRLQSSSHSAISPSQNPSHVPVDTLAEIESGDVRTMTDSTAIELLEEMDQKRKKLPWMPFIVIGTLALLIFAGPVGLVALILSPLTLWLAHRRDVAARTTVILYDLDDDACARYQRLHDAFAGISSCRRVAHISAKGATSDWKRNAGAGHLVRRKNTTPHLRAPHLVKTNVDVPAFPVGRQTLHFFPDRLLVVDRGRVGAVAYSDLSLAIRPTQFIETDSVPTDSQVVGQTWQYPNKTGGPDKRFKNNRQIPVVLYEQVHFTSGSGLNELIHISRIGAVAPFADAIRDLASTNRRGVPLATLGDQPTVCF